MIVKANYFITSSIDEVFDFFLSANTEILEPNEEIVFPEKSFNRLSKGSTFTLNTKLYNKTYVSKITVKNINPKTSLETYQEDPSTNSTTTIYFKETAQRVEVTQVIDFHFKGFSQILLPLLWPLTWPTLKRLLKKRITKITEKIGRPDDKKSIRITSLWGTIAYWLFIIMVAVISFNISMYFKNNFS